MNGRLLASLAVLAGCGGGARPPPLPHRAEPSSFVYERLYRAGTVDEYRLTLEYVPSSGAPYLQETMTRHEATTNGERITITALSRETNGKVEDWTDVARAYRGHDVSLASSCKDCVQLPDLGTIDPRLVEPVTDVITFFVAVSSGAGIANVQRAGDRYALPTPVVGRWAHGKETPVGEDCIAVSIMLREITSETATYVTAFEPPTERCLTPALPVMEAPIGQGPNNFQQVMVSAVDRAAMWGREQFVVTTVVRRSDGTILEATMDNQLVLRTRLGCADETLQRCQMEVPMRLQRKLHFQRVSGS